MGIRPVFYAVDPAKVEAVWNCHDADLLRRLKESAPEPNELFKPKPSEPTLIEALEEIVDGQLREEASSYSHRYHYAVEHICSTLGEVLEERDYYCGPAEHDWDTRLDQFRSVGLLPLTFGIPHVSYLTGDELKEEQAALHETLEDDSLLAAYEHEEDALRDLHSIMQEASDKRGGLYLFYY